MTVRGLAALGAIVAAAMIGCPPAAAAPACGDFGATPDTGQTCQLHTDGTGYTVDIRFPADYPDSAPLLSYLATQRTQFLDYVASFPPVDRPMPYELSITSTVYRSGTPDAGTESVVVRVGQDVGAHPVSSVRTFSYDLGAQRPITFDTLFTPGSQPLDIIYPLVRRQFEQTMGGQPVRGGLDPETYQNFAITDDAVVFYFDQDQLFGQNEGPLQVSVPRADLAAVLA
ncbi:esterase [Mycobacterium sp. M26]|uniref:esterase n=1 Tax=Mycobacterium sp. M26 TaxID=1762962 RepID=UPI00073F33D7|nr:esterase [Mycobacterium sp. M26]